MDGISTVKNAIKAQEYMNLMKCGLTTHPSDVLKSKQRGS